MVRSGSKKLDSQLLTFERICPTLIMMLPRLLLVKHILAKLLAIQKEQMEFATINFMIILFATHQPAT
jgi:hypothetical protein